jgi:hypothetical protein
MSTLPEQGHGQQLASRLEELTDAFIAVVEPCTDAQWQASAPNEGCSVGVLVHHIASVAPLVAGWAAQIAHEGVAPTVTMDMVHEDNAQHATQHAAPNKAQTLELLRHNTAEAARIIRSLNDDQLARMAPLPLFGGQPTSAQVIIEMILLGHLQGYPHSHQPSIEAGITAA